MNNWLGSLIGFLIPGIETDILFFLAYFFVNRFLQASTVTPKPPIKPDEDVRQKKTQLNALKSCKKWMIIEHTILYEPDRVVLLYEHEWGGLKLH